MKRELTKWKKIFANDTTDKGLIFPGGASGKESACQCRRCKRHRFNPSGRSLGEGNDNSLQYSHLENSMDRETWWITLHGVTKSWTFLSIHTHILIQLEYQKKNNQDHPKKCAEDLNRHFSMRTYRWPISTQKDVQCLQLLEK